VRTLQKTLISTFEARAWAIRQVVTNKGGKTPGVDQVVWTSAESKMKAIEDLKIKAKYKASPVRRILIPKEGTDKFRALGIPTMKDRAMQALHALALIARGARNAQQIRTRMDIDHTKVPKMQ
jgi:RNA-directed DNA polymerase